MSEEVKREMDLRKYLLGMLNEPQTEEIEKILVSEEEYFQELQIAEAELIEDFVDERLNEEERKAFDENFILTAERREEINFARALRKLADEKAKPKTERNSSFFDLLKSFFFAPIPAICSVLIIFGIAFFVWWSYPRQSEVLVALNKSQKNERPTESRITDFEYAPKTEGTRGSNDKPTNLNLELAKSLAIQSVDKNRNAENLHSLGQVFLAEKKYDEAINNFEGAIKLNPNIAKLNNDLGAALMEKGRQKDEGKLELFARANQSIEKSLELDKNLKEAYFNRALVIELLNLPNQAKEAWENYLKLDSASKWADEARDRLRKLEANKPTSKTKEQVLRDFLAAKQANDTEKAWQTLSRNREMITGKLIPQQLAFLFVDSKVEKNEAQAQEALDALIYAGELEKEKSGDLFWRDLANFYKNFSDEKISDLKNAHELVKSGYNLRKNSELKLSIEKFRAAKTLFAEIGNNYEPVMADYWIGSMLFQLSSINESNSIHLSLVKSAEKNNYKWVATQSYIRLVYSANSENKHSLALQYNKKAFDYAKATDDFYNLERILNSFANINRFFGNYKQAFLYSEKALQINPPGESISRQLWLNYETMANTAFSENYFHLAIEIQKEAEKLANTLSDSYYMQLSNMYLGMFYTSIRNYETAKSYLEKAITLAENLKDTEAKAKALSIAKFSYGNLMRRQEKLEAATNAYKESIGFASSTDFKLWSYEGNKGLLLSYLKQENEQTIREQIKIVLDMFRKYRSTILEEQNRNDFFDQKQDIYDIAAEYEFNKENFAAAFDYAEESRSRSLLDLQNSAVQISTDENKPEITFSANLSEPQKLNQIQAEMPANAQLLVYSVTEDKTLIWLVTKENLHPAKSEIGAEKLQEKVISYLNLLIQNTEPDKQLNLSKELHQILISPIKDKLNADKQLFIIPDKILFRLPFAALYADKYLLEDYKISYSPSANIFLNCSSKAKDFPAESPETLLSIGNPSFNQSEYENTLKPLPSAKDEAIEISKLYVNPKLLIENEATKQKITENLANADVVHFAGHYVVEEKSPSLSSLILAGDKKEESNLANYEIIGQKYSQIRLIVLSACDTGVEKFYRGEGMIGASRAFLASNIPLVVASQWAVDSESAKEMMIRFHQLRKTQKLSTADALRQAQLEMMKDKRFNQPYYWAAFVTLGGYTQF